MALLVGTQDGNWKVINEEERAVELLDKGLSVYILDVNERGRPVPRRIRVREDSRVTEVRTVSAEIENDAS